MRAEWDFEKTKKILHTTFLQVRQCLRFTLCSSITLSTKVRDPKERPLLMAAFYELKGRCFRFDFFMTKQSPAQGGPPVWNFPLTSPEGSSGGGALGCVSQPCVGSTVCEIKISCRGDVSIGKAEHPSTPERRKISIWRRFLSFVGWDLFDRYPRES